MGKEVLEPVILDEVDSFCDHFVEPNLSNGVDLQHPLTLATSNIILRLLLGRPFKYDDSLLLDIDHCISSIFKCFAITKITRKIPFVRKWPGDIFLHKEIGVSFKKVLEHFDRIVAERRKEREAGRPLDLLADSLLVDGSSEEETRSLGKSPWYSLIVIVLIEWCICIYV